ncbi:hypothetical protein MA16_Dca013427 [Dendrobium catenatum]|uniref:Uncharacterized protein n=1 Tax=Dendrobium catenatum TaxID=906689 RepID=A0A2I0X2U7_9ASPA|nr:hypothetical protein MA16_Dca013427 [Dendrobium catenatum]
MVHQGCENQFGKELIDPSIASALLSFAVLFELRCGAFDFLRSRLLRYDLPSSSYRSYCRFIPIRGYDVQYSNSGDSRRSLALFTSEWYYWTDLLHLVSGNSLTATSSLTKSRVAPGAGLGVSEARQIGILLSGMELAPFTCLSETSALLYPEDPSKLNASSIPLAEIVGSGPIKTDAPLTTVAGRLPNDLHPWCGRTNFLFFCLTRRAFFRDLPFLFIIRHEKEKTNISSIVKSII